MLNIQNDKKERLVIVGGGFAVLELAKRLKNKEVEVIVVDNQ